LLERAAGFERDDPPAGRLAKLEALVARAIKDVGESAPLLAALLSIPTGDRYPPLELTPEEQKQRTLKVLLDHLIGLAAQQPVLAVYEDVHWVDPSTLELLGQLIERIERLPILVVITFRQEFSPPWPSHGNITPLPLSRLARRQGASMIEAVAGGKTLPPEVLDQIVARTDGVPLFVEELTKTLIESGLLQESGDRYTLNGSLSSLTIPTTIHDSLLARLDRLGAAKETAQLGAALGREFSHELLAAVSPLGQAELQETLTQIINAGLLFRRGSPPDATYTFKHALVRDAAYAGLLRSRRQQIHSRIAQALKDEFPERVAAAPELLAHHYGEAGLTELAVQYWEQAGTRALERSANIEAVAHYRTGLVLLEGLPEGVRSGRELPIQIGLGSALTSVKGYASPETGAAYERARELCLEIGDQQRLSPVLYGLWNFDTVAARHLKAKGIASELVRFAEQQPETGPRIAAHSALGTTYALIGAWSSAHESFEKCIGLYDMEKHASLGLEYAEDPCVGALIMDSLSLWNLGYSDKAVESMNRAVDLAEKIRHAASIGFALCCAPMLHYFLRNPEKALSAAQDGVTFAEKTNQPVYGSVSRIFRGWALSSLGTAGEGIEEIRSGIDQFRATGSELFMTCYQCVLCEAYRTAHRFDDASKVAHAGLQFAENRGEGFREAELHRLKGLILLSQDNEDLTGAEEHFARALEVARNQQSRSMELRISTDLASLWHRQGKAKQARELLAPIYNWFTEGFNTPALKNAKALLDSLD
jgi:predicted ATPase